MSARKRRNRPAKVTANDILMSQKPTRASLFRKAETSTLLESMHEAADPDVTSSIMAELFRRKMMFLKAIFAALVIAIIIGGTGTYYSYMLYHEKKEARDQMMKFNPYERAVHPQWNKRFRDHNRRVRQQRRKP